LVGYRSKVPWPSYFPRNSLSTCPVYFLTGSMTPILGRYADTLRLLFKGIFVRILAFFFQPVIRVTACNSTVLYSFDLREVCVTRVLPKGYHLQSSKPKGFTFEVPRTCFALEELDVSAPPLATLPLVQSFVDIFSGIFYGRLRECVAPLPDETWTPEPSVALDMRYSTAPISPTAITELHPLIL